MKLFSEGYPSDFRKLPEKWIDVKWDEQPEGDFPVELRLLVANQRGVLATVAANISDMGANIENVNICEHFSSCGNRTAYLNYRLRYFF